MNLLGLDLGTKTGMCHLYIDEHAEPEVVLLTYWNFNARRGKAKESPGMRFYRFRTQLAEYIREHRIDVIYYEDVKRHAGTIAAHVYGGFKASMMDSAFQHNLPVYGLGVGTIKKFATGRGNANKDLMIEACRRAGYEPQNDNVADAFFIAQLGAKTWSTE